MRRALNVATVAALALISLSSVQAQNQTSATQVKPDVLAAEELKRASEMEDSIAAQFEQIRKEAHLRELLRAGRSGKYRELLCSASIRGVEPDPKKFPFRCVTTTSTGCPGLRETALKTATNVSHFGSIQRFTVTAYPTRTPNFPPGAYWVELDFLMSPFDEWFDKNLTDEMFYKNDWKQAIVPECKNVH